MPVPRSESRNGVSSASPVLPIHRSTLSSGARRSFVSMFLIPVVIRCLAEPASPRTFAVKTAIGRSQADSSSIGKGASPRRVPV